MSIFTFISRRPKIFYRPKPRHGITPVAGSLLSWKRFKAPRIKRGKWFIALQKWRHIIFTPAPPAGFIATRPHKHRFISRRPLKFFFRAVERRIFPPAKPTGFIATRVHRHRFISRRPQRFFFKPLGLRHLIFTPTPPAGFIATHQHKHRFILRRPLRFFYRYIERRLPYSPSNLSWKRFKAPKIKRGRWPIALQRWRHVIFPPAQPSGLTWRRFKPPKIKRKRWSILRHPYVIPGAVQPPVGFIARVNKLLRVRRKKFYPRRLGRYVFSTPPPPVGFIARASKLLRMRRRRPYPRPRDWSVFSTPAAPPIMVLQRVWRVFLSRPSR